MVFLKDFFEKFNIKKKKKKKKSTDDKKSKITQYVTVQVLP